MMGSYVQIGTAKDHTLFPVFDMIKFSVKEGLFIQFHRSMKKFLLDLEQGNYTRSLLRLAFSLSSTYALILLELMLQYQGRQKDGRIERDLDMEELRFSMDVPENAYGGRIDNFRRRVLDAAIREINEKTDYHIEPKYGLLRGQYNRVTGFHFVLHLPEVKEQEPSDEEPSFCGMEERLKKYGIHWSTARRLSKMPHVEGCLQIAVENIQKGKAKNPAAYIKAAIEQDWQGQRETVERAMEEEKRERMDKKKGDVETSGRSSMVEDAKRPEEQQSLEEIASSDSPFSELARKILSRRKGVSTTIRQMTFSR